MNILRGDGSRQGGDVLAQGTSTLGVKSVSTRSCKIVVSDLFVMPPEEILPNTPLENLPAPWPSNAC